MIPKGEPRRYDLADRHRQLPDRRPRRSTACVAGVRGRLSGRDRAWSSPTTPRGTIPSTRLTAAVRERWWATGHRSSPWSGTAAIASGNNAAIRPALEGADPPRYVLLLNPDTVVRPGPSGAGRVHGRPTRRRHRRQPPGGARRDAPAFGVPLPHDAGRARRGVQVSARCRGSWPVGRGPAGPEGSGPIDWVAGASMIIRRKYSSRSACSTKDISCISRRWISASGHAGPAGPAGTSRRPGGPPGRAEFGRDRHRAGAARNRRPGYWFLARRRYFLTHHGRVRTLLADLAWSLGHASYRLRRWPSSANPSNEPRLIFWDFIRFNFFLARR